ncbi:hypothetical protein QUC31_015428 [Theobroma cacao]
MPVRNQNGVVMGFPADYFETPPRYEEPTITTAAERPLPCNNADEKPHPCVKWLILTLFTTLTSSLPFITRRFRFRFSTRTNISLPETWITFIRMRRKKDA